MIAPPAKIAEITANALVVNLAAIPVAFVVVGLAVFGVTLLPRAIPMGELDPAWCLAGIVVTFTLHELLHALALVFFAHLPWTAFKFGIRWQQLVICCHCRQAVTIRAYRYCTLAPLTILGSLTILATLLYPAIWLALVTGVHLSGCIGDVWMFVRARRFPEHFLFLDSPNRIGGEVFEPAPVSVHELVQTGMVT